MRILAAMLLIGLASEAWAGNNRWTYESKKDAFTDQVNSYANYYTGNYGEFVTVRCKNNEFDVVLGVGEYIDNDGSVRALFRATINYPVNCDHLSARQH